MNKQFSLWLSIVAGMIVTILEIIFQCNGADIASLQSLIGNIAQYNVLGSLNPIALLYSAIAIGTVGNILCCAMTTKLIGALALLKKRIQSINQESL